MRSKKLLLLLIFNSVFFRSEAQLGKLNIGLNARVAFLTHIESDATEYLDIYQNSPPRDLIFNTPITFRYTSNSLISLRYQIEYRKEDFNLLDKYSDAKIQSTCKYLINGLNLLIKLNKSHISNTSISFGLSLFHSLSQNYKYINYGQIPGGPSYIDTTLSYSSSEFNHLKSSFSISINRETVIKENRISLYREVYTSIPVYRQKSEIPVFDSMEFGFTIGISYNFIFRKSP